MTTDTPIPDAAEWWHNPFRIFQTNIREVDSGVDVEGVVQDILGMHCNVWLLNVGGIVSHYPSALDHQHPSPWLAERASGDLIGDAVAAAHRHGVRVIARCDFSKLHADQYAAHPDWFFVGTNGEPQVYNGLYSACPSGPYYQEKAFDVISEIMDRYQIDAFFFNWFSMNIQAYGGHYYGICQCAHCARRFHEFSGGMTLPRAETFDDPAYEVWRRYSRTVLDDIAGRVRVLIKSKRPDVCLLLSANPDVSFREINNAVDRKLPLWRYDAGDYAKQLRTGFPERPVAVNAVMFWDMPYRYNAEQPGMVQLSLAQIIANGANPYSYVTGHTRNQPDRKNFGAVRSMMAFHAENDRWYGGRVSGAEVLVVSPGQSRPVLGEAFDAEGQGAYRGVYRALVESHIPFDALQDDRLEDAHVAGRLARYRAIVLPNAIVLSDRQCQILDGFVAAGGGVVATSGTATWAGVDRARTDGTNGLASLGVVRIIGERRGPAATRGSYLRVTDRADMPDRPDTDMVPIDRVFLEVEVRATATASFTYTGATRFGPPEKCWWADEDETNLPGLLHHTHGDGRTAYFPWPVDSLFAAHSLIEYKALLAQAVRTVAGPDQVTTDLPPQVEVTIDRHAASGATLVHFVNGSGHQDRSYFDPIPMFGHVIAVRAVAPVTRITLGSTGSDVPFVQEGGYVRFTLARLDQLELAILHAQE